MKKELEKDGLKGEALEKRGVAAHIFESAEEAQSDWRNIAGSAGPLPGLASRAARGEAG